jgi:hypothetical protein
MDTAASRTIDAAHGRRELLCDVAHASGADSVMSCRQSEIAQRFYGEAERREDRMADYERRSEVAMKACDLSQRFCEVDLANARVRASEPRRKKPRDDDRLARLRGRFSPSLMHTSSSKA